MGNAPRGWHLQAAWSNLVKFPIEIISAEIKIYPLVPVVAFGQAVVRPFFLL